MHDPRLQSTPQYALHLYAECVMKGGTVWIHLPQLIRDVGVETVAQALDVDPRRVKEWKYRKRYPRRKEAGALVLAFARQGLTLEGVYFDQPLPTTRKRRAAG